MSNDDRFIRYICSLKHQDTGTLAALRRACGQRLAQSRNCQTFASVSTYPVDFLTVTLVCQYSAEQIKKGRHHTTYKKRGSVGAAWARYCRERNPEQDPVNFYRRRQEAVEKGQGSPRPPSIHERFRTLLEAELELDGTGELAHRLCGLVRMLVAEDVPLDAIQLVDDLRGWRSERRYVQERWARAFYGPSAVAGKSEEIGELQNEGSEEEETKEQEGENNAD